MVRNLAVAPGILVRGGYRRPPLFPQFGLAVDLSGGKNKSLCLTSDSANSFNVLLSCSQTRTTDMRRDDRISCTKHVKRF